MLPLFSRILSPLPSFPPSLSRPEEKDLEVITVGPWGSSISGEEWSYNAKYGVEQIIIRHGDSINHIIFKGHNDHNDDYSSKFGGNGGYQTFKVNIDFPFEYLTGFGGTSVRDAFGHNIRSLRFQTNRSEYGPFGVESGTSFSFNPKGGVITGFHGRAGRHLFAIGVYVKPVSSLYINAPIKSSDVGGLCCHLPRSAGPWGSSKSGKMWDDGVFSTVRCVYVYVCEDKSVISAIRFGYEMRNGTTIWSTMHGNRGGDIVNKIELDGESEFLMGIEGSCGLLKGDVDVEVITSLAFQTNKGKYGPFGTEIGAYFTSLVSKGKVVGFHGISGAYLNAIGVHTEYDHH